MFSCVYCSKEQCFKCESGQMHKGLTCSEFTELLEIEDCRFCGDKITLAPKSYHKAFRNVCQKPECFSLASEKCCTKTLDCGHSCDGIKNEINCLPCLHQSCVTKDESKTLGVTRKSDCAICYTEAIGSSPSI